MNNKNWVCPFCKKEHSQRRLCNSGLWGEESVETQEETRGKPLGTSVLSSSRPKSEDALEEWVCLDWLKTQIGEAFEFGYKHNYNVREFRDELLRRIEGRK